MKCLILAAGYATRLYPLTENFPKPLLCIQGKPILDWLIEDMDSSGLIDEYVVISNHKFAHHFHIWANLLPQQITVLDDGTTSNETRLGAVRDIQFAIDKLNLDDDLLVIAGDNLLDFSLTKFIDYALNRGTSCIMRYFESSRNKLQNSGVVTVGEDDLVLKLEEKPVMPESNWCCPAFYFYRKKDIALVSECILAGCGTDAPGSFIAWLASQTRIYAMEMPGRRFDIGNLDSFHEVQERYEGITC